MLTVYLDDSDAETSAVTTIAGYVAEEEAWAVFEDAAEDICRSFGVDVLHCREFDANKACFRGWSIVKKTEFMIAIRNAMLGNVEVGVSRSIPKDYYQFRKRQLKLDPSLSAYGFAFGSAIFLIRFDDQFGTKERVMSHGLAIKVEGGHKNNADLQRYVGTEIERGNLPATSTIEFVEKTSCRAIQMADLLAFYSRRKANKWFKSSGRLRYFPDVIGLHVEPFVPHNNGLIEEPYREATLQRTGETFLVNGLVTMI